MNRFYMGDDLVVDLSAVSFVGCGTAVIGGISVKVSPAVEFDLKKQFRAFKEAADKKEAMEKEREYLRGMSFERALVYSMEKAFNDLRAKKIIEGERENAVAVN